MKKSVRILLYALSIVLVVLVIFFMAKAIRTGSEGNEEAGSAAEEESAEGSTIKTEENQTDAGGGNTENSKPEEGAIATANSSEDAGTAGSEEVTLVFAGDVLLGNSVLGNYNRSGLEGILSEDLIEMGQQADIFMINQEFPFSTRGTQAEDKQYTFRTDPKYADIFTEMGIDIVSLANNHILDFGTDALLDSCSTLDQAGILYCGAGENSDRAQALQIIEVNDKKFGFLAASRVWPETSWSASKERAGVLGTYDSALLLAAIEEAKEQCDFLTVYVHWGVEYEDTPQSYQVNMGEQYIESGADLVIGAHTHCLQGVEYFDGKPVFYSLGNYVFGMDTDQAAAVEVTVEADGTASCRLIPMASGGAYTWGVTGEKAQSIYQYMENISFDVSVDDNGIIHNER